MVDSTSSQTKCVLANKEQDWTRVHLGGLSYCHRSSTCVHGQLWSRPWVGCWHHHRLQRTSTAPPRGAPGSDRQTDTETKDHNGRATTCVCTHTQATLSGSLKNDFFLWVHRFAGKVRLFRRHGRGARTGSSPPEVAREQEHRGWLCVLGAASHPADTERVVSQGTQTAAAQGGFLFHAVGERWPKR